MDMPLIFQKAWEMSCACKHNCDRSKGRNVCPCKEIGQKCTNACSCGMVGKKNVGCKNRKPSKANLNKPKISVVHAQSEEIASSNESSVAEEDDDDDDDGDDNDDDDEETITFQAKRKRSNYASPRPQPKKKLTKRGPKESHALKDGMASIDKNYVEITINSLEDRDKHIKGRIENMTVEVKNKLLFQVAKILPEFETMANEAVDIEDSSVGPEEPENNSKRCICGLCQDMPTEIENKCCRDPDCITSSAQFRILCLEPFVLVLNMRMRNELLLDRDMLNIENNRLRFAAYSNLCLWLYGRLGIGNRLVLPACTVRLIRSRFPSQDGVYKGFRAGFYPD